MLRLKCPHGYNKGIGVNFFYDGELKDMVSKNLFARILLSFSCHPNAIKKIYCCLKYSGQYSCFLQAAWFLNGMYELETIMKVFNVRIEVFFLEQESLSVELKNNYEKRKNQLKNVENIVLIKKQLSVYTKMYLEQKGKHFTFNE